MARKRRYILAHHRSPGDIVCLTALARDIHLCHPGEFEIDVHTTVKPLWDNNPHLTRLWNHDAKNPILEPNTKLISCQYGLGIREQKHETIHFCAYFHRDFRRQTGVETSLQLPYGDIHLSDAEKTVPPVLGRYWLVLSGGKSDFTIKVWHTNDFQTVTDRLGDLGLGVVQTGATANGHWHPQLRGSHVLNLVGWGGIREFIRQIYHADGVICGVTAAQHIAAALHKPCVVIAGGREAWYWEAYTRENAGLGGLEVARKQPVPHRFLHTIGRLDCCSHAGCWKNKVVQLPNSKDRSTCKRPVMTPEMPVAECMQMISPNMVVDAVLSYYYDGTITPPQGTQLEADVQALCRSQPGTKYTEIAQE